MQSGVIEERADCKNIKKNPKRWDKLLRKIMTDWQFELHVPATWTCVLVSTYLCMYKSEDHP